MRSKFLTAGCLLSAFAGGAFAQSFGGSILPAIAQLVNVGVVLSPTPSSMSAAIQSTQTGPTSGSTAQSFYNQIAINADAVNGSTTIDGVQIVHSFGGSNLQAARQSLDVKSSFTAASSASNTNPNYVAGVFQMNASSGDGGTNTGAGSRGQVFGANPVVRCQSGAINLSACQGMEVDTVTNTGSSMKARIGVGSVSWGNVAGASLDAAYTVATATGQAQSWGNGIVFAHTFYGTQPALTTGGCGICTDGSADTIATGMDLSSFTISGNFLKGPGGFSVNGSGITTQGLITPATSSAACSQGQIEWDASFVYICTATNTWKRATLATF